MNPKNTDDDKSIFDLDPLAIENRLQPATDRVRQEIVSKGLPFIYQDDRCPSDSHFIHEYEDGRISLMLLDIDSREFTRVKDRGFD